MDLRPPGGRIPGSSSKLAPGVDLKADGGYVIAPPSVHPNGNVYEWDHFHDIDWVDVAPCPPWLKKLLCFWIPELMAGRTAPPRYWAKLSIRLHLL